MEPDSLGSSAVIASVDLLVTMGVCLFFAGSCFGLAIGLASVRKARLRKTPDWQEWGMDGNGGVPIRLVSRDAPQYDSMEQ